MSPMDDFDIKDAKVLLDLAYNNRDEVVLCLLGAPGIGKTEVVRQHAEAHNANLVTIIASQILPNEVSGITMPVDGTHSMEIYDHARLSSLKDGDILFFDELLEADDTVLSACLTLIESRMMMSGKKLPDVQIIAASNETRKPSTLKLSIRQRFVWVNIRYNDVAFKQFLEKNYSRKFFPLVRYVVTESDSWNALTPRSFCKILDLALSSDNIAITYVRRIAASYNLSFAAELMEILEDSIKALDKVDALCVALVEQGVETDALFDNDTGFSAKLKAQIMGGKSFRNALATMHQEHSIPTSILEAMAKVDVEELNVKTIEF